MKQEQILDSFVLPEPRAHQPAFAVQPDKRGWRLYDGDRAIALFMHRTLDIWAFSPFEDDIKHNLEPPQQVVDLHTLHNTDVNFGMHGWPKHWCEQITTPRETLVWEWLDKGPETLAAQIAASFTDGESCRWLVKVAYDPAWGRYRYTIDIDAAKLALDGFEPLNMMLAGALACRGSARRWSHSIWDAPDGAVCRLPHSNALFHCTDYGTAPWRSRNIPFDGGWVGYAAHPIFNPATIIHHTNTPMRLATCSQLFDEHIIWADAGTDNIGEDGYFHFAMRTELVNMSEELARSLLDEARDATRPKTWRKHATALAFHMDQPNSFEEELDPWEPETCPIIAVPDGDNASVRWARGTAHSGERSLLLRGGDDPHRTTVEPEGAVCNVEPGERWRLRGWVRTRGVERFARLARGQ